MKKKYLMLILASLFIAPLSLSLYACDNNKPQTKTEVAVPTIQTTSYTYDGTEKTVLELPQELDVLVTTSGTLSATNAGNYTFTLTLKDTSKYIFDNNQTSATIEWNIKSVVKFYNESTLLETQEVVYGQGVTYSGQTPQRDSDNTYTYAFNKWVDEYGYDVDLAHIQSNELCVYADFSPTYIEYPVTLTNATATKGGVEVLSGDMVHYGEELVVHYILDEGYVLDTFTVNGQPVENGATVSVTGAMTVVMTQRVPTDIELPQFKFTVLDDNKVSVAAANTTISGDVTLPKYVSINDDIYTIAQIANSGFLGCSDLTGIEILGNEVESFGNRAFEGCNKLESITIPSSVTSIGIGAFYGCSLLDNVILPNQITEIAENTFYNCSSLTSITIPSSVTSLGNRAFNGCTSLSSIIVPSSVTSLGTRAFSGCTNLTSITIPSSVTSIGSWAFNECSDLSSVVLGTNVVEIGDCAFYRCSSLTSITIPSSVTSIGIGVFYGCSLLDNVILPNQITVIAENTFYNCSSLTSIAIPSSVTSLGNRAFNGCTSLSSIIVPSSVTSIGSDVFNGCNLTSATLPYYTDMSVHSVLNGANIIDLNIVVLTGVTSIGFNAFCDTSLTSIVIPSSVTSIGASAFYGCTNLTSITIPSSITSIGGNAFHGCTNLTTVAFESDSQLTGIGYETFEYCANLESIVIGNNVTSIGNNAFHGCTNLTTVAFESDSHLTSIGSYAFSGCTSLTNITIPDSVTSIASWAFNECSDLSSVVLGTNVVTIGDCAFYRCSSLTSITIPASVTRMGIGAFQYCENLGSITFTSSVPTMGKNIFYGCNNLTSVEGPFYNKSDIDLFVNITDLTIVGSSTTIANNAFANCTKLVNLTIGPGIVDIGEGAFYQCSNLSSLTLGNDVEHIGQSAFYGCQNLAEINYNANILEDCASDNHIFSGAGNLTSGVELTIGDNVTYIPANLFRDIANPVKLTKIVMPASVVSIGTYAFATTVDGTGAHVDLYYAGSLADWCAIAFNDYWILEDWMLYVNQEAITELVISSGTTAIPAHAFYFNGGLISVTIDNSVETIGTRAFMRCENLRTVVIGNGVTEIDGRAFRNCTSLEKVYIASSVETILNGKSVPEASGGAFSSSNANLAIFCEADSKPDGWDEYFNNYDDANKLTTHWKQSIDDFNEYTPE